MMSNEALGPLGRPTYKEYAGDIGSSGSELLIALQTVLDLSQAESGQLALDRQNLSLAEAANSVMGLVHLEAERAGIELQLTLADKARVFGDHRLLKQILLHALRGTIGSAGHGHTVTLVGREAGIRCVMEIAHDGLSWVMEDLPGTLLDQVPQAKFHSPANAAVHPYASRTALHLALVQSLVRMSDGELEVVAPPAGGRVLRIALPASAHAMRVLESSLREASAA
jgi:two-component system cell cycle sensor histidine kinase PleC